MGHLFCIYLSFQTRWPHDTIPTSAKNINILRAASIRKSRHLSCQGLINQDLHEVNLKGNGKQSKAQDERGKKLFLSTLAFIATKFSLGNRGTVDLFI